MGLKRSFKKFAGKPLAVHETHMSFYSRALRRQATRVERSLGDCENLRAVFALAAKHKMYVRIYWPGQAPQDKADKRLNLFIKKDGGTYKIDRLTKG